MKQARIFLAILLTFSLVLTAILPIGATNSETQENTSGQSAGLYEITDGKATIDGEEYIAITTADALGAMELGKNYILANDIDCSKVTVQDGGYLFDFPGNSTTNSLYDSGSYTILNGNGYTLTGINFTTSASTVGIFKGADKKGGMIIRDLNIGTAEEPAQINATASSAYVGALWGYVNASATAERVNVYADITVASSAIAGGLLGGYKWGDDFGHAVTMTDCAFYGSIQSSNTAVAFGGIVGKPTAGSIALTLTRCTNYGELNGATLCGGIVGDFNGNTKVTLNSCVNNGAIMTSLNTGALAFGGMIGKISGSGAVSINYCINNSAFSGATVHGGMIGQSDASGSVTLNSCVNNANLTTVEHNWGSKAAGMIGQISGGSSTNPEYLLIGCINNGTLTAPSKNAGGMIGEYNAFCKSVTLKDCQNYGDVVGANFNYGGMIGQWTSPSSGQKLNINNCINYGKVGSKNASSTIGELLDNGTNTCTVSIENYLSFGVVTSTNSSTHNGTIASCGSNYTVTETNVIDLSDKSVDDAITTLNSNDAVKTAFGKFMKSADDLAIPATPVLKGIQKKSETDGDIAIRLVATIGNTLQYQEVGFKITLTGSNKGAITKNSTTVYKTLSAEGVLSAITAESLGGTYLYALAVTDIPVQETAIELTVQAYAIGVDGTEYALNSSTITITNGQVTG